MCVSSDLLACANAGPYRSGQWFDAKRDACKRWFLSHGRQHTLSLPHNCNCAMCKCENLTTARDRHTPASGLMSTCNRSGRNVETFALSMLLPPAGGRHARAPMFSPGSVGKDSEAFQRIAPEFARCVGARYCTCNFSDTHVCCKWRRHYRLKAERSSGLCLWLPLPACRLRAHVMLLDEYIITLRMAGRAPANDHGNKRARDCNNIVNLFACTHNNTWALGCAGCFEFRIEQEFKTDASDV